MEIINLELKKLFSLKDDQATNEEIRERIKAASKVDGSNMYILIAAILIASIGLNIDSTAVVIGAMLISPIMSLIISISYGIVIHDLGWIKNSVGRFALQIGISIITSTVYFYLSPLNSFSSELLARTNPTLWDAMIAIFGGFAAIIASTRQNSFSNVIPGAAIATALMPPLCTVGYCIANTKWLHAAGAFYLFMINVVLICLANVVGLKLMHATKREYVFGKRKRSLIVIALILILLPSSWLAFRSVKDDALAENFANFVEHEFDFDTAQVVKSEISREDKLINIVLIGSTIKDEEIQRIASHLTDYKLDKYALNVTQTKVEQGITKEQLGAFIEELNGNESVEIISEDKTLLEIQTKAKKLQVDTVNELMLLYPTIKSAGFLEIYNQAGESEFGILVATSEELAETDKKNIQAWLGKKFERNVKIVEVLA